MASRILTTEEAIRVAEFRPSLTGGAYGRVFEAIGREDFQQELLGLFNDVCGADSVHLFWIQSGRPDIACGQSLVGDGSAHSQARHYMEGRLWRDDRQMGEGSAVLQEEPMFYRMDTRDAPTSDLREFYRSQSLLERLMICGWTPMGTLGFSVMRAMTRDITSPENLQGVGAAFCEIFPMLAKHMEMVGQSRRLVESLTTLPLIEEYLAVSDAGLSQREIHVGARLLYGLSASCIASDLGIGTETVNTHRKRLYERLRIGCHHELLLWYLRHCGRVGAGRTIPNIFAF